MSTEIDMLQTQSACFTGGLNTKTTMKLTTQEWEGNAIAFRTDNAYASLTHLCMVYDKRPAAFLQNESTKQFIEALCKAEGKTYEQIVVTSKGGDHRKFTDVRNPDIGGSVRDPDTLVGGHFQGTWAHPDLALECTRWLDPAFAIWCNRVIRGIFNGSIEVDTEQLPPPPIPQEPVLDEDDDEEEEKVTEVDVHRVSVMQYVPSEWPQEFMIALGKRVKSLALAFGVPVKRQPSGSFGALFAWPEELYSLAMSEMHRDPRWDHVFGRKSRKYTKNRR